MRWARPRSSLVRARSRWPPGAARAWGCRRARSPGCWASWAVARAARRATPTYTALVAGVRASPVVAPDETGWRFAGRRAWLWAFAGKGVVVYRIAAHRGYPDAVAVLGEGFAGVLERDGWAPYRKFTAAVHQSCVAHLLRRVGELLADAKRGQAKTPHAVGRILQRALWVRDQRDAGKLTVAEAAGEAERLGVAVDRLIAGQTTYPPNRRLLAHLGREREPAAQIRW